MYNVLKKHRPLKACTWNCRSIRNKIAAFQDYLFVNKIRLFVLTQTWLSEGDDAVRVKRKPDGFKK